MYSVNNRLDLTSRSRDHLFLGEEDDSRMWGRQSDLWTLQRQQQQWPREEQQSCQIEEQQQQHHRKRRESILGRSYLNHHQDEVSSCTTVLQEGRVRWEKGGGQDEKEEEHSGKQIHKKKIGNTSTGRSGSSGSESTDAGEQLVRTKTMRVSFLFP